MLGLCLFFNLDLPKLKKENQQQKEKETLSLIPGVHSHHSVKTTCASTDFTQLKKV